MNKKEIEVLTCKTALHTRSFRFFIVVQDREKPDDFIDFKLNII